MMLLQLVEYLSILPFEAIVLGALIFLVAMYIGLYKLKHKNDPYFPPGMSPPHDKVSIILSERTSTGISIVDIIEGKWGVKGLYVPKLDRIYYDVPFTSGKRKIVHFTKGVDGLFKPASLAVVQTVVNYKEVPVNIEDPETGEVIEGATSVKEEKGIEIVEGDFKNDEEKRSFLTFIIPSVEEYRLTMGSFIESIYQLAQNKITKNLNPSQKNFIAQWLSELDTNKVILLGMMLALVFIYLLASDGLTAMVKACPYDKFAGTVAQNATNTGVGGLPKII